MVYLLPKGGWRWLWTAWLIAVSVLTFLTAIEILDKKGYGFIGLLPMVCLCFVAVWPLFDVCMAVADGLHHHPEAVPRSARTRTGVCPCLCYGYAAAWCAPTSKT
ncbi:MAG: hypothetical protein K6F74_05630 [Prevotella sp.]|nr:hypothetical protein [Prevotella sp.]